MATTVKITGFTGLAKAVKDLANNLEVKADKVVELNVREMVRNAKRDAPKDVGGIAGATTAKKLKMASWEMVCDKDYAIYLETGTKGHYQAIPGIDPSEFKSTGSGNGKGFFDNILAWVKRKKIAGVYSVATRRRVGSKIDKQKQDEQTAWAIYLSIKKHGIKAQPFFFKQGEKQEPILQRDIAQLLKINEQF